MPDPVATRHLSWEAFEARINRGTPSVERIAGIPRIDAVIESGGARIGLRIHGGAGPLPASPLSEITVKRGNVEGLPIIEVATNNPALYRDFYSFCCAVADRVQHGACGPTEAIAETLVAWAALLRRVALLSPEQQIGLIGELWFLGITGTRLPWREALDGWKGPRSEEHDFVLQRVDVEVKATTKERRVHQIGSLTQLEPKPGRPLFVLSVQLTEMTLSAGGKTLPEWISAVRDEITGRDREALPAFHQRLSAHGWIDEHSSLYSGRFGLRTVPTLVPVDERCPALVRNALAGLDPDRLARIERVSYAANLEELGVHHGEAAFNNFLFGVTP